MFIKKEKNQLSYRLKIHFDLSNYVLKCQIFINTFGNFKKNFTIKY